MCGEKLEKFSSDPEPAASGSVIRPLPYDTINFPESSGAQDFHGAGAIFLLRAIGKAIVRLRGIDVV
jgi:hypothetical protein